MNFDKVNLLLSAWNLHPVLVDVGASGFFHPVWKSIADNAIYIGFDPDQRDIDHVKQSPFYKTIIVDKAIIDQPGRRDTTLFLTHFPHCSSILEPNFDRLQHYLYNKQNYASELFRVVDNKTVSTITLNEVSEEIGLSGFHWIKLDTQGIDLRVLQSIHPETFSRVLAIDVEPGFVDYYQSEDTFSRIQTYLDGQGFWLSDLTFSGFIRLSRETVEHFSLVQPNLLEYTDNIKRTPGWVRARYLRKLETMNGDTYSLDDYRLLWVFALLDMQYGYAFDTIRVIDEHFASVPEIDEMIDQTIALLEKSNTVTQSSLIGSLSLLIPAGLKTWIKQFLRRE